MTLGPYLRRPFGHLLVLSRILGTLLRLFQSHYAVDPFENAGHLAEVPPQNEPHGGQSKRGSHDPGEKRQ